MVKEYYTVSHEMADGTELDDITGYVIPDNHPVYDIFRRENEARLEASA
ncbi:BOW99_gp33 family protein [Streptococcus fryi]